MNTKAATLPLEVRYWSFLGPALGLIAVLMVLLRESPGQIEFPLAALIGIAVSWRWQMKGLGVGLGLTAAVACYRYFVHPEEPVLWELSCASAIGLSCFITAFSSLEIDDASERTHKKTTDDLTLSLARIQTLESTFDEARAHAVESQERAEHAIAVLKHDLNLQITHSQSIEEIISIARQELTQTSQLNNKLNEELFEKRHLAERLEEQLGDATEQLNIIRADEEKIREGALHTNRLEIAGLEKALSTEKARFTELEQQLQRLQEEHVVQQAVNREMSDVIETLSREKQLLESTLKRLQDELETHQTPSTEDVPPPEFRRMEGMYKQLREQFDEKSKTLDDTRRDLFLAQEKVALLEKEREETERQENAMPAIEWENEMSRIEKQFADEKALYQQEIDQLYALVDSLVKK